MAEWDGMSQEDPVPTSLGDLTNRMERKRSVTHGSITRPYFEFKTVIEGAKNCIRT